MSIQCQFTILIHGYYPAYDATSNLAGDCNVPILSGIMPPWYAVIIHHSGARWSHCMRECVSNVRDERDTSGCDRSKLTGGQWSSYWWWYCHYIVHLPPVPGDAWPPGALVTLVSVVTALWLAERWGNLPINRGWWQSSQLGLHMSISEQTHYRDIFRAKHTSTTIHHSCLSSWMQVMKLLNVCRM